MPAETSCRPTLDLLVGRAWQFDIRCQNTFCLEWPAFRRPSLSVGMEAQLRRRSPASRRWMELVDAKFQLLPKDAGGTGRAVEGRVRNLSMPSERVGIWS